MDTFGILRRILFYIFMANLDKTNEHLVSEFSHLQEITRSQPAPDSLPVILIAEDDPINIFLLETMLSKTRAVVWHVENGRLAVEYCSLHPEVSLVLMDLKMPEMDGFEATRLIKAARRDLPVIAVTAFAMSGDRELALEAGCDDYLPKPFTSTVLKEKVGVYLNL